MRARGTLILLVLFLVVGGYALFIERHRPTPEEREEKERVVLDLDPSAITEIRLVYRDSTLALVREEQGGWRLVEPRAAPADQEAATKLAAYFDELKTERWLEAAEVDSAGTGLGDPWLRALVATADSTGGFRHELALGSLNATDAAYYARLAGEPRIALLASWVVDSKLTPTFARLRDRRLARFDPEAAHRIDLIAPDRRLTLLEEEEKWRIVDPRRLTGASLAADPTAVRTLLHSLAQLEATDFIVEGDVPRARLAGYGLAAPRITVTVRGAGDSLLARIEIGAPAIGPAAPAGTGAGGGLYARSAAQPAIVLLPPGIEEELAPEIEAIRDRRLVDLGVSAIDTLRVITGSRTAVVVRDSTGAYRQAAGGADPEVDRVAANLPHLRVSRFVHDRAASAAELRRYGLDRPTLRLVLTLQNGETREVAFGRAAGGEVFARWPDRPGVALVGASSVADLRRLTGGGGGAADEASRPR